MSLHPSRLLAELGWTDASLYVLGKLLNAMTFGQVRLLKYYLTAQPVPTQDLTPRGRGRSITVTEASPECAVSTAMNRPRHVIEARLKAGCRCVMAHRGGHLVGFQWFTLQDYLEDEVRCLFRLRPEDRCAWDFDIYVKPEARMLPVFSKLWDASNAALRDAGADLSLSRINAFNAGSRRSHWSIGAWSIGWAVFMCAGSLQFTILSTRPWLHLSMSRPSMPVVELSRLARSHSTVGLAHPSRAGATQQR